MRNLKEKWIIFPPMVAPGIELRGDPGLGVVSAVGADGEHVARHRYAFPITAIDSIRSRVSF
jgi:hypothetical protein